MAENLTYKVIVCILFTLPLLFRVQEASEQSKYYRFGTKTAYYYDNATASTRKFPGGCRPVHLNMVLRHGSRYPSKGDIRDSSDLLTKLKKIHSSPVFRYKNVNISFNKPPEWEDAEPKELSSAGEKEQYGIAKRFLSRFHDVFDKKYWNKYYKFVSSDRPRTARSAMSFAYGLFEDKGNVSSSNFQPVAITFSGDKDNDKLLLPYDACPRYATDVVHQGLGEVEKFNEGPEIKNLTKRLEERLQITGNLSLTFDFVEKIFRLCAFGFMNRRDTSWCSLLEEEDIKVLKYQGDLQNYYEHSYGNKLSYEIVCPLLSDIIQNLRDFSTKETEFHGVFRFTSSGTVISLLTMLGLFQDTTRLRADNYQQNDKRNFTSNLVPMSANVAVVLYACNSTETAVKLQVLVNEEPAALPCCDGKMTCSLDEFLSYFKETVDSCDFDEMCSLPLVPPTGSPTTALAQITSPRLDSIFLLLLSFAAFFLKI